MTDFKRGDRVKVTLEGIIDAVDEVSGWWVSVRPEDHFSEPSVIFSPKVVNIEIQEDLVHGAVYKDNIGDTWQYIDADVDGSNGRYFLSFGTGTKYHVDVPARPLKRVDL